MNISAKNLSLAYQKQTIVNDLSVKIDVSKITAIIGPNGCGKSTLLRGLTGLLRPLSGCVELNEKSLDLWSKKQLAKHIAILSQNPLAPDGLTVKQLVEHGRFAHQSLFSKATKQDIEIVDWAMEQTNVYDMRGRLFKSLSGGERQRAWIALALAQKSNMLFLDEPTTFLDIGHQFEIMELLQKLNQQHKIGIAMVLHDVNQACIYSDRLIAMRKGKIIVDGHPSEIINASLMYELFNAKTEIISLKRNGKIIPYCIPLSG